MITTLSNGIRVVFVPSSHTLTAAVAVFVNTGSLNESKEENGISHFLEHMAFKGTARRTQQQISSDAERLGAMMNAFTSHEMTAYYIKGLGVHVPTFIDILGDIFCHSIYDPDEIAKERDVILQEYAMYADDPNDVLHHLTMAAAFPNQPLGRKIIGEPKNIKSFTGDDLRRYIGKHHHGSNIIIGVSGSFDQDEALRQIEQAFKEVPADRPKAWQLVTTLPEDQQFTFKAGSVIKKKSVKQAAVSVMFDAPKLADPLHYHYKVAAAAIGDGMSSPLFQEIREKRGLVYQIDAYADAYRRYGTVTIFAGTSTRQVPELLDAISTVIQQHAGALHLPHLERAKNTLSYVAAATYENPFNLLMQHVSYLFSCGAMFDVATEVAAIQAVTSDDATYALHEMCVSRSKVVAAVGRGLIPADIQSVRW